MHDQTSIQVKDIGELSGPLLLFGGVYSNLQALEQMMAIAKEQGFQPEQIICTGDVVGYCARPEEVVQAIRDWGVHCIAGNVELQLRDGEEDCGCDFNDGSRCDIFSRQWYPYAQSVLSKEAIEWMHALPHHIVFRYAGLRARVVHGSVDQVSGYVFHSTPWSEKNDQLQKGEADLIIGGHCGLPFNHTKESKYWLNPGVIGMPANDATTRVWYMTLNDKNGLHFTHHSFDYDHNVAATQMREKRLPEAYALTLETGLWDNCEILPEQETAAQGERIDL
ncbi:MAG: metallophosphoesterase family protein [Bacteroidota bacterium]